MVIPDEWLPLRRKAQDKTRLIDCLRFTPERRIKMLRSTRLLELVQLLRQHRYPVAGAILADRLNISLRTLYRDIATLQHQGAVIEGEAGIGYVLRSGYMLPPLMFTADEIDALVLGTRWVADRADEQLSNAAHNALIKIAAVLPPDRLALLENSALLVGPAANSSPQPALMPALRKAIRDEVEIHIAYQDRQDKISQRILWPIALAFFDNCHIVVAWCSLRQDFRHFRLDRIQSLNLTSKRYTRRRTTLLKEWRRQEGIKQP
jgi:predicted DNA-binding transcriptional regulator YafY